MNKRRRYRAVFVLGAVCLLIVGAGGLWLLSEQRQEILNRQLIAALVTRDTKQALALVNAGADPNTPFEPLPPPSLTQLWNHLIHRTAILRLAPRCAFHMTCGAYTPNDSSTLSSLNSDEPLLVETMLKHGARKDTKDVDEFTPLLWSVATARPKTVGVLLKYGADVNVRDSKGVPALYWALVMASYGNSPAQRSERASIVSLLLSHGADPNLPGWSGRTPLQLAQRNNRLDLVALLKQAGAKK